jgi:nuclear polyadenylated RNA-binding protein NAB2
MGAGGPPGPNWMMQGQQPSQMDLVAMLEQQNQMMFQLSQQLMSGGGGNQGQQRRGKSLFDRAHHPHKTNQRGQHQNNQNTDRGNDGAAGNGEDVDMSGNSTKRDPPNPEETVCKYNLHCTNKDCKFVHQSPAAPPGTTIDMSNVCSFGAACKNRKCNGRHPSPAQRTAHQNEQECKFFPNCQNPRCPFKHPSMPLCRNGADCTTPNCKFTHVKTKCKFNPCLNPTCAFAHDEGQQGGFKDKVWTADESEEHVSERKFVDEKAGEELITADNSEMNQNQDQTVDEGVVA